MDLPGAGRCRGLAVAAFGAVVAEADTDSSGGETDRTVAQLSLEQFVSDGATPRSIRQLCVWPLPPRRGITSR